MRAMYGDDHKSNGLPYVFGRNKGLGESRASNLLWPYIEIVSTFLYLALYYMEFKGSNSKFPDS